MPGGQVTRYFGHHSSRARALQMPRPAALDWAPALAFAAAAAAAALQLCAAGVAQPLREGGGDASIPRPPRGGASGERPAPTAVLGLVRPTGNAAAAEVLAATAWHQHQQAQQQPRQQEALSCVAGLAHELLLQVLRDVGGAVELCAPMAVCRRWRDVCRDDALWLPLLRQHFGVDGPPAAAYAGRRPPRADSLWVAAVGIHHGAAVVGAADPYHLLGVP